MAKTSFFSQQILFSIFLLTVAFLSACQSKKKAEYNPVRETYAINTFGETLFDRDWKFTLDNPDAAEQLEFNDSSWRNINLPHDWSIEDVMNQSDSVEAIGPFTRNSPGGPSTGHVLGGTAWYRKNFTLDHGDEKKKVFIHFDGVYMNADIWINGNHLGNHPYGYTAFSFELTPFLKPPGEDNILAVQVKNEGRNSRWYSGSGIYRHVWLKKVNPDHFKEWGININTESIKDTAATISFNIEAVRKAKINYDLIIDIYAPDGNLLKTIKKPLIQNTSSISLIDKIFNPEVWSPSNPNLYIAKFSLVAGNEIIDQTASTFGIRTIKFSAMAGIQLNGKSMLLKGACIHHDNGPLGSATIDRAEYRKIALLKKNGFNAIRTAHNPPSRQFLDACDYYGMLVIDEAFDQWKLPKNPEDYNLYFDDWWKKDIKSMVLRDRNHPSIIMWSIGNEIKERADSSGIEIANPLVAAVKKLDTSRPTSAAICGFWEFPGRSWSDSEMAFSMIDVAGYNYQWQEYGTDHSLFPDRIILGTESFPMEAYDNWEQVKKHPFVIGDFVWTGMDYFGESGIGHAVLDKKPIAGLMSWPWHNGFCGDIDVIGNKKPQSYYRDVVWEESQLEMAIHVPIPDGKSEYVSKWGWPNEERSWTWPCYEGELLDVNIYSNYNEVQLVLNGDIIASKMIDKEDKLTATFEVEYQPGQLIGYALSNGKIMDSIVFETAGLPASLQLQAERRSINPNINDLAYINLEVLDNNGNLVPNAEIQIDFVLEGVATLAAVGNGNPAYMASFHQPRCTTYKGRCQLIARPTGETGEIMLIASSPSLPHSKVLLEVK